jgi:hypothetical protein
MDIDPNSKRMLTLVSLIIIALALALGSFFVFAVSKYTYAVGVPEPTAVTGGKVSSTKYIPGSRTGHYECSVIFLVEDKPHYINHARCLWAGVGDEVNVIYQTTHPDRADVDNRLFWDVFGIIGGLLLIVAYVLFRKSGKLLKNNEQMRSENGLTN